MADRKPSKREARREPAGSKKSAKGGGRSKGAEPSGAARGARRTVRSLTTGWAAVLLALLVVLFFNEVFLGGKTFVSPDATAPVGFVRMGEKALYETQTYPLWNPFVFLGMPSFASGAYNPLIYPPDWPLALVQKVVPLPDMTWLLLYYFLGAFFMFLLARDWGARREGALLAAAAFVFAPNLVAVGSHGHGSQLVNSAYIPLMLWLTSRWLKHGGLHHLGWLALAGGFQFLRGHVQICFYSWAAVALLSVVHWAGALRSSDQRGLVTTRAAGVLVAAALAFGLAGFYNLPLRDYAQYSIRGGSDAGGGVGIEYASAWSMALHELPAIAVPGWVGFGGQTYWGGMPFTDYPNAYMGIVAVLLLIPAFLRGGAMRIFALLLGGGALLVSLGNHFFLYQLLYDHLPLFNKFRVPVMVIVLFQVAAALGLAWGWSAVLDARDGNSEAKPDLLQRVLLIAGGVVAVVALGGFVLQDAWRDGYIQMAMANRSPYSPEAGAFAYGEFIKDLGRAGLIGLLALVAAWLALKRRISVTAASLVVLGLMLFELWPVSARVMRPVIGAPVANVLEIGRDDVVNYLESAGPPGSFRILPLSEFQSNRYAGFGISTVGGYHAAKTRLVQDFIDAQLINDTAWLRLLNVRYLVANAPLEPLPPFLREVFRGSAIVYENGLALPRVTVLGRYDVVQPAAAIFDSVRFGALDPVDVTYLEEDPGLTLGPVAGATAEIASYGLNDVTVRVNTPGPALVRLADLWYPDWQATVDGEPAEVLKADYLLRAVSVPAGEHVIEFHFRSPAVRTGLTVSIVSLALILALLGAGFAIGRRRAKETADGAA